MPSKPLPSPAYLHKRLRYEPSTGKLYWRAYAGMPQKWITKWAGKEALACNKAGYRCGRIDNVLVRAHRVIWAMVTGAWPAGEVDHQDHDRANNRIRNLRVTDDVGTARNQTRHKDNTSGVMGVDYVKRDQLWRARIGRRTCLGTFHTFSEAVVARRAAERAHGYHPNHGTQ